MPAPEKELTKAAAEWPNARFAEVWNSFADVPPFGDLKPVKKFGNRAKATMRIWSTIQRLQPAAPPAGARRAEGRQCRQGPAQEEGSQRQG